MRELLSVTGMVLKAAPAGEFDKRLVILTRERGKITAFARGAKRPGNMLMAPSRMFAFGTFKLIEGRDAYSLSVAEISNYFEGIQMDVEAACYGSYFLEMADYYSRENVESTELLKLIYQSLRALLKPALPNELVRRIYELRAMVINGEYTEHPPRQVSDSANYAWEFTLSVPVESLFTFTLKPEVLKEFSACVDVNLRRYIDREFHSLEILDVMNSVNRS